MCRYDNNDEPWRLYTLADRELTRTPLERTADSPEDVTIWCSPSTELHQEDVTKHPHGDRDKTCLQSSKLQTFAIALLGTLRDPQERRALRTAVRQSLDSCSLQRYNCKQIPVSFGKSWCQKLARVCRCNITLVASSCTLQEDLPLLRRLHLQNTFNISCKCRLAYCAADRLHTALMYAKPLMYAKLSTSNSVLQCGRHCSIVYCASNGTFSKLH